MNGALERSVRDAISVSVPLTVWAIICGPFRAFAYGVGIARVVTVHGTP